MSAEGPEPTGGVQSSPVKIWDLPVRVVHWAIAALFGFSWWTAENDRLDWHMLSGYAILTLLLFRIYWGLVGSSTARFAVFVKGPAHILGYARGLLSSGAAVSAGHNPMGALSVIALLSSLLAQTALGLFAIDEDNNAGPLNYMVSYDAGRQIAHWHHVVFNVLLYLVGLHLAAVAFYTIFKRENLIGAMLTGGKRLPRGSRRDRIEMRSPWWALPGLAAAALIVAAIVLGHY
jgi:cytochrome b